MGKKVYVPKIKISSTEVNYVKKSQANNSPAKISWAKAPEDKKITTKMSLQPKCLRPGCHHSNQDNSKDIKETQR